jgi:hypothetical protein
MSGPLTKLVLPAEKVVRSVAADVEGFSPRRP